MNKIRFTSLTASLVLAITFTLSCEDKDPNSFKDSRDGKTYKKVTIGSQTWMAENLNFAAEGSKCYDNKPENCEKYGCLYDWETAMKACPFGWHLPSDDEWTELMNFLASNKEDVSYDEDEEHGTKYYLNAGKYLKSNSGWNKNGNGTDDFVFSALPGGDGSSDGSFSGVGNYGYWWSAYEYDSDFAYYRYMDYNGDIANQLYNYKSLLFSVRCVQD